MKVHVFVSERQKRGRDALSVNILHATNITSTNNNKTQEITNKNNCNNSWPATPHSSPTSRLSFFSSRSALGRRCKRLAGETLKLSVLYRGWLKALGIPGVYYTTPGKSKVEPFENGGFER